MNRSVAIFVSAVLLLGCLVAAAADWPQWRGPNRDGISQETGLLKEWPAEGPQLLWQRTDLGDGYSTPAVVGDRLYVLSNRDSENELVQALATSDGHEVWSTPIGKVGKPDQKPPYPGTRSTPTVDGDRLYALGSDGDLACLETASGKVLWQLNIATNFSGKSGQWAYAESPLVDGDLLVCTPGGERATLVALDKKSGQVIWQSAIPGGDEAAYASITVVQAGGIKQYVQFLQNGLVGVEAKTGKFLWRYDVTAKGSPANIPTPVSRSGLIYSAAAMGTAGAVRLRSNGSGVDAEQAYINKQLPAAVGGAIELNGNLYGTSGGLTCANFATGEVKWQGRGVGAGSILYADGRLYLHSEKNGEVALVEATPEEYREKGRFTLPDRPAKSTNKSWAYPVVANGRLYFREADSLWCYDIQQ